MRIGVILLFIFILSSCAQNTNEKVREAIDRALTFLSSDECDEAIQVLEDAGMQTDNAIYLQVLASAYACKAGYNEISFVLDDLTNIDTTDGFTIFSSISTLSLSSESSVESTNYTSIRTALELLHNSTTTAGQVAREEKFGARKAGDMGVQALLLNVVLLGKFLNYYGNVNSSGVKGLGTVSSNTCFINYTEATAQTIVSALPAANHCNSNSDGHPELSFVAANLETTKRRLCEGLMTITNLIDILENVDLSGSSELGGLEDIASEITQYKVDAEAAGLGTLINTLSQSECETLLDTPANLDDMQTLYAMLFEAGLQ